MAVVNPRQVRDFARAMSILAKTDAIDARVIARFDEVAKPVPKVFDKDQEGLRESILRRRRLVEQRTAEKNRLQTVTSDVVRKSLQRNVKESGLEVKRIEKALLTLVANDDIGQGNHNAMCVVAVPASAARCTWRPSARSRTTR